MLTFRAMRAPVSSKTKALAPRTMTLNQWALLPDDEPGEWVSGQLVEEEMPSFLHELIVMWFGQVLNNWVDSRGGFVAGSDAKFQVSKKRGRKPDVSVYLPRAKKPELRGLITVAPSIAIEIISPSPRDTLRDRVHKLAEYAEFGVKYYWLVDPELRSFEVLELNSEKRYVHVLAATAGIAGKIPGCPGLKLDLSDLWARIDRASR